tara:strand:- start:386 stop:1102 length:717 start_codon:yes stop_codon:yes gene_type:complete
MAYHGYYTFMKEFLEAYPKPSVLEVGVDKGQTFLPLHHHLSCKEDFLLVGVDVHIRDDLWITFNAMQMNLKNHERQMAFLHNESSLEYLPKITEQLPEDFGGLFHLILVDGDHNYYTVKKEFEEIPKLLRMGGLIMFDDYDGRWSHQDEYFSEFEEYKDNKLATKRVNTEKKGVKPAIDEFLEENKDWELYQPDLESEVVFLFRKGEIEFLDRNIIKSEDGTKRGTFKIKRYFKETAI